VVLDPIVLGEREVEVTVVARRLVHPECAIDVGHRIKRLHLALVVVPKTAAELVIEPASTDVFQEPLGGGECVRVAALLKGDHIIDHLPGGVIAPRRAAAGAAGSQLLRFVLGLVIAPLGTDALTRWGVSRDRSQRFQRAQDRGPLPNDTPPFVHRATAMGGLQVAGSRIADPPVVDEVLHGERGGLAQRGLLRGASRGGEHQDSHSKHRWEEDLHGAMIGEVTPG